MSSELQMLPLNDSRNEFLLGTSFAPIFKSVVKQKPAFKKQRRESKLSSQHILSAVNPTTWWSFSWLWLREL